MNRSIAIGLVGLLVLGALTGCGASARKHAEEPVKIDWDKIDWTTGPVAQFVFFSVLEGLYEDGVENATVDAIIPLKGGAPDTTTSGYYKNFIYACPLCTPAYEAFRLYRMRPKFAFLKTNQLAEQHPGKGWHIIDNFGEGLPNEMVVKLTGDDASTQRQAVQELVKRYVSRRFERMAMTPKERREMRAMMAKGAEEGLKMLKKFQEKDMVKHYPTYQDRKDCSICRASVDASKKQKGLHAPTRK
jgi:hypothetical protein